MPRRLRIGCGGMAYHVLNRRVARLKLESSLRPPWRPKRGSGGSKK